MLYNTISKAHKIIHASYLFKSFKTEKLGNTYKKGGIWDMLLEQQRQELIDFVTSIPLGDLYKKPTEDAWDILQILAHLALFEKSAVIAINEALVEKNYVDEVEQKPVHLAADRTNKVKTKSIWEPEKEHYTLEEVLADLEETRKQLQATLSHATEEDLTHIVIDTDAFGELSLTQYVDFINYHEARHCQQIKENANLEV